MVKPARPRAIALFPDAIRHARDRITSDLLRYADWFSANYSMPDSTISRAAVNDAAFLSAVRAGKRDVTVKKYDAFVAFFDSMVERAAEPAHKEHGSNQASA